MIANDIESTQLSELPNFYVAQAQAISKTMIHQICKTKFGFGQILSMSIKLITVAIFIHQAFQISDAATIKQDDQRSNKPPNDSVAQGSSIFGDIQPYVSSYDILGDANGAIDSSSLDTYVDPMKTAASE